MATLELDGAQLVYEVEGDGAHTLAFAHGWCSKMAHWDAQVERFRSSHRIVRWDRRGMGRSRTDTPAASPSRHGDDLAAILDAAGIERVTVAGHAGGGPTALAFAADHPDRTEGLILVDTTVHAVAAPGEPDELAASVRRSAEKLTTVGEPYFRRLYATFFGHRAPADVVADAIDNAVATPLELAASEMLHLVGDTAAYAARVRCPVLWVSAIPGDTALAQRCFDDVMVGHVVGSGHFVQLEVPEQCNAMIAAFLADKVH